MTVLLKADLDTTVWTLLLNFSNNVDRIDLADGAGAINLIDSTVQFELGTENSLKVASLSTDANSKASFKLSRMGTEQEKVLDVTAVTGDGDVGYTGNVSDELAGGADEVDLFSGVNLGDQTLEQVSVDEGIYGDGAVYTQNADGSVVKTTTSTNSLLTSAHDLAMANAYMWRSELTSLSDRMGTLRTLPETAGVWARYTGGSFDGDDFTHDYNTIEIGADISVGKNFLIGMSFDYTQGESDLAAGSADSDNYSVGFYGSYFNDNGCFLDAMFKIGSVDADYKLNNRFAEEGDYTLTGVIFGIETGHRWTVNNWFIEPQLQLTYSNLASDSYRTNLREVSFDTMESLIARVGVMSGLTFAQDKGSAYAKVSYNHDFLGDVEGDFTTDGVTRTFKDELDDNWGETSLGMNYRVNDSVNTFVDLGCTFGGDIDQDWRVNLGARYMF